MLNFCKRAIQEFEDGDMYKRREIFIKLGSHFTLQDKKLDIKYKKSIFKLKTELDSYRAENTRFAPVENADIKAKLPPVEVVSSRFLGNQDSNLE